MADADVNGDGLVDYEVWGWVCRCGGAGVGTAGVEVQVWRCSCRGMDSLSVRVWAGRVRRRRGWQAAAVLHPVATVLPPTGFRLVSLKTPPLKRCWARQLAGHSLDANSLCKVKYGPTAAWLRITLTLPCVQAHGIKVLHVCKRPSCLHCSIDMFAQV